MYSQTYSMWWRSLLSASPCPMPLSSAEQLREKIQRRADDSDVDLNGNPQSQSPVVVPSHCKLTILQSLGLLTSRSPRLTVQSKTQGARHPGVTCRLFNCGTSSGIVSHRWDSISPSDSHWETAGLLAQPDTTAGIALHGAGTWQGKIMICLSQPLGRHRLRLPSSVGSRS